MNVVFKEQRAQETAEINDCHVKNIDTGVIQTVMEIFDRFKNFSLEERPGQSDMAMEIAEAIREKQHIMLEAGSGVGRSLGYLIPAVLAQQFMPGVLFIATASAAHAAQVLADVEQVKRIMAEAAPQCRVIPAVVKGGEQYVCPQRVAESQAMLESQKVKRLKELHTVPAWIWKEAQGCKERQEFSRGIADQYWKYISGEECAIGTCPESETCFSARIQNCLGSGATIVVVPHEVLLYGFSRQFGAPLSQSSVIIIDEAHRLEENTRQLLTVKWTKQGMLRVLHDIRGAVCQLANEEYTAYLEVSQLLVDKYFEKVQQKIEKAITEDTDKKDISRFFVPAIKVSALTKWSTLLEKLHTALVSQNETIQPAESVNRLGELIGIIKNLAARNEADSADLFWIEGKADKPFTYALCTGPKNVDTTLRQLLFGQRQTPVIVTSSTLCQAGETNRERYQHQIRTIGFAGATLTPKESPFPNNRNAMLYIPANIHPLAERKQYLADIAEQIDRLSQITKGRTLVLFTASEDLQAVYDELQTRRLPWKIIKQTGGVAVADARQEFIHSKGILLATGCWDGIDIKGSNLSSVIIARLPFPASDPITEYKAALAADSASALVPEMLVKLRQGAGLLFEATEAGLVSILDARMSINSPHACTYDILDSLPIKNITGSLASVKDFCDRVLPKV